VDRRPRTSTATGPARRAPALRRGHRPTRSGGDQPYGERSAGLTVHQIRPNGQVRSRRLPSPPVVCLARDRLLVARGAGDAMCGVPAVLAGLVAPTFVVDRATAGRRGGGRGWGGRRWHRHRGCRRRWDPGGWDSRRGDRGGWDSRRRHGGRRRSSGRGRRDRRRSRCRPDGRWGMGSRGRRVVGHRLRLRTAGGGTDHDGDDEQAENYRDDEPHSFFPVVGRSKDGHWPPAGRPAVACLKHATLYGYCIVMPPFGLRHWPVRKLLASDARKRTQYATSAVSPTRRSGENFAIGWSTASFIASSIVPSGRR